MDQATVFISYSRKQFYVAEHLARKLEQQGLSPWLDVQKILPGVDWQASIDEGLATCQALILVASRSAYKSAPVQYEVSTARAAGKPIYLAVIEDTPFVAELSAVATVIDCQGEFSSGVTAIVEAFQTGKRPKRRHRRAHPLGPRMPFGRWKYYQLLWLCLCYALAMVDILLQKQVVIHGPFNARLWPFLVLATIPVVLWCLVFAYSLRLLLGFRRQSRVTYLELELWPALNVFLFPALSGILSALWTQDTGNGPDTHFGPFFNAVLSITDRTSGPTFGWQLLFLFSSWVVYLFFVALTLRGWLLALGWLPLVVVLYFASALPGSVLPLAVLVVGGGIVFLSMRRFLNGRDVPFAFGEKWEFVPTMKTLASRVCKYLRLVPGIKHVPFVVQASLWKPDTLSSRESPLAAQRAWGCWLTPGAFPNEAFLRVYQQARAPRPRRTAGRVKTWGLFYVPADASLAQSIRRHLSAYPALCETTAEASDYQIALLSNKTPRRWVEALAARYPLLVCIMVSSLDFRLLTTTLQQHQWIDYRQQRPYQIDNLAKTLSGLSSSINPTTPENFARTVAPYPVKLVVHALRMGGAASVALGVAAQLLAIMDRAALAPFPLVVMSVMFGIWAWWEAGRLLARDTMLTTILLTWGALFIFLGFWLVTGAAGALLPREVWVHNGFYNGALTLGLTLLASFVGLPFLLFLLGGGFELVRHHGTLRCWLPRPDWPRWQRTLAVLPWRRLDLSLVLYVVASLAVIATLVVDSPHQYPHIHEYDIPIPSSLRITSGVLAGPDGNIWFGLEGDAEYDIGSLAPNGDIQPRRFSIPEPARCLENDLYCFHVSGLRFGPDHHLWYVATQVFPPYTVEIQRATLAGSITRFPLPKRDLSGVGFTFDAVGNLWYTRQGDFLDNEPSQIGRLDATSSQSSITEFALPAQSLPTAIVAGPDGNLWFFDDGTHTIGKITPLGAVTEYPLPYQGGVSEISQEEMIVGADHNLWFSDPQTGVIGRITTHGQITLYDGKAHSFPTDLLVGPDGGIWFLDPNQQALGDISPGGQLAFYPFHTLISVNSSLTIGPDGAIWVALYNQIGRVTTTGGLTLYDVPSLDASLWGIVTGPNQHLWFVEYGPRIIGELTP